MATQMQEKDDRTDTGLSNHEPDDATVLGYDHTAMHSQEEALGLKSKAQGPLPPGADGETPTGDDNGPVPQLPPVRFFMLGVG